MEMMNGFVIKNLIIVSLIFGGVLGLCSPVPYLGMIALAALLLFSAPAVILYLIMAGKFDPVSVKDGIISGAVVGFFANISFSLVYAILTVILAKAFHYVPNIFLTSMITNSPLWILGMFIIFIGVLCATVNAFSGFATYYVINFIRDMYERQHPAVENKDFEEKEGI